MTRFSKILRLCQQILPSLFAHSTPDPQPPAPTAIRVPIGTLADFPEGRGVAVSAEGRRLAIFRFGERILAIDNVCTHNHSPLADGVVRDTVVTCRTHGARFNLETGAVVRGPARKPVRTYPVRLSGETVEVEVS